MKPEIAIGFPSSGLRTLSIITGSFLQRVSEIGEATVTIAQRAVQGEAMSDQDQQDLWKERLIAWAERNGVRPADFARNTGYSYGHAHQLLRGDAAVTNETLGRILTTYGSEVAAEISGQSEG